MTQIECKRIVAETGRILLQKGLVARTWGNISARADGMTFAISPSGLGYENMEPEDVPVYNYAEGTWQGNRKPSSEKKIHAAAYEAFPDVSFVIHTHQDYATAAGLVYGSGEGNMLPLTPEEKKILGDVRTAGYGLPGTKRLKNNVASLFRLGCKTVLMKHHGAVVLGKDREEAFLMTETLENACKRLVLSTLNNAAKAQDSTLLASLKKALPDATVISDACVLEAADDGGFRMQLDDLAQMIGTRLTAVKPDAHSIDQALDKHSAVLVKGVGCFIRANAADDTEALKLLISKAAMTYVFTKRKHTKIALSAFDCELMRLVFKYKYSRKKAK